MCFHIQTGIPCRHATASSVVKVLLEKIIPIRGIPLKFHGDQGTLLIGQVLQQLCDIWPIFNTFTVLTTLNPHLVECSNGIIITQLTKLVKALQKFWPKCLGQKHCHWSF